MQKTASKNIIPSGSYEFFKSASQYNYRNYYTVYACKLQIMKPQNGDRTLGRRTRGRRRQIRVDVRSGNSHMVDVRSATSHHLNHMR